MKVLKSLILGLVLFLTIDLFAQSDSELDEALIEAEAKHLGMSKVDFINVIRKYAITPNSKSSNARSGQSNRVSIEQPQGAGNVYFLSNIEKSPNSGCYNLDFENKINHLEGWYGDVGTTPYGDGKGYCTVSQGTPFPVPNLVFETALNPLSNKNENTYFNDFKTTSDNINQRFQVMSNKNQFDPYFQQCLDLGIYSQEEAKEIGMTTVAKGSDFSIKLGNNYNGYQQEKLLQVFSVSERYFSYNSAIVFDNPTTGHGACNQPFFMVRVYAYSEVGGNYIECANYVIRSGQADKGIIYPPEINGPSTFMFPSIIANGGVAYTYENAIISKVDQIGFRPWQTNTIDFEKVLGSDFMNKKVRIEFTVSDCSAIGHFGYAYIDGSCLKSNIFSNGILCKNNNVKFFSNSTGSFNGEKYLWRFGDGTTSTDEKPCHTYANLGTYNVELELTLPPSAQSCTNTLKFNHVVVITDQCITQSIPLNFEGDCLGAPTLFSTPSNDKYQSGTFTWDFGDGKLSNDRTPCHTFSEPKNFLVKLKISPPTNTCMNGDANALSEIFEGSINLPVKNCNPALSALGNCTNRPIALKNSSNVTGSWRVTQVDDNGSPINGNVFSQTASTLCNNFVLPGKYKASFTAATTAVINNGCPGATPISASPDLIFTLNACPPPEIEYQGEYCNGSTVFISSRNTDPYSTMPHSWSMQGPAGVYLSPEQINALYFCQQFNVPGIYKLNLTFQPEDNGCPGSANPIVAEEKTMVIKYCPPPEILAPVICLGQVSKFFISPPQEGSQYTWRFGDGSVLSPSNNPQKQDLSKPLHTYLSSGSYEVGLDLSFPAQNGCNVPREIKDIRAKHNVESCQAEGCVIFHPEPGKEYLISAWASEEHIAKDPNAPPILNYAHAKLIVKFLSVDNKVLNTFQFSADPNTPIIDEWQKIEGSFKAPSVYSGIAIQLASASDNNVNIYYDDIRFHPIDANMKSYVYDPTSLRLMAELDENNYATLYEYDKEGKLVRLKKETERGVKTIKEFRDNIYKVDPK